MAWAKIPAAWIRSAPREGTEPTYALPTLLWKHYAATGMAALMLLMLLSVKCNRENRERLKKDREAPKSARVRMSYDEMQRLTGFHRKTIGKAISLLEGLGAMSTELNGRANVYELALGTAGGWRKLPEGPLFDGERFVLSNMPRQKASLNALKLYFVLLHLYSEATKTTAISYTAIAKWSGIRREEISTSMAILHAYNLARPSFERDVRHSVQGGNDQSQRYFLTGLSPAYRAVASLEEDSEDTATSTT